MPRPLGGGDAARLTSGCLSDVDLSDVWRLSVCRTGLSREQRPRMSKIGTEVAHGTRLGHHFQGQKVKKDQGHHSPGHFGWLYWQANMDIELVTAQMHVVYRDTTLHAWGGGILWRHPAYSLLRMIFLSSLAEVICALRWDWSMQEPQYKK